MDKITNINKKQQILNAAFDTIYENTIGSTNLREIARRAGMSPGNLHYYYPAKETLLIDLLDYLLITFLEERKQLVKSPSLNASEKLAAIIQLENIHVQKRKEMCVFMDFCINGTRDEIIQQKIQNTYKIWLSLLESVIEEGINNGSFSAKHAKLLPDLLISMFDGASLRYYVNGEAFNLEEYFSLFHTLIADLLAKPIS